MTSNQKQSTTKDSLIDAAIRLLSSRPSASLSDVAEAAGVKRVTLHRLIGSRDDLLEEIAFRSLDEMDRAATVAADKEQTAIGKLRAIVAALVPIADRCHFLWQHPSIWESEKLAKEIKRHDDDLGELLDWAKQEGSISFDIPNAWIIACIDAIVYAAQSTARSGDIAVNDAANLAVNTLFRGIEKSRKSAKQKDTKRRTKGKSK